MTADIMELWAEIAAGALPEGITIGWRPNTLYFWIDATAGDYGIAGEHSVDSQHRAAMLLIVDGWERQGYAFERSRLWYDGTAGFRYLVTADGNVDIRSVKWHEREIIALGKVLAELGRAVKEGQA
jgi:hypothetical protein